MQLDMENDMEVREQENAISVRDVTKVYRLYDKPIDRLKESMSISHKNYHRDFYALSGLSFQVKKGETVGIIGHNGSGKTTLLYARIRARAEAGKHSILLVPELFASSAEGRIYRELGDALSGMVVCVCVRRLAGKVV